MCLERVLLNPVISDEIMKNLSFIDQLNLVNYFTASCPPPSHFPSKSQILRKQREKVLSLFEDVLPDMLTNDKKT